MKSPVKALLIGLLLAGSFLVVASCNSPGEGGKSEAAASAAPSRATTTAARVEPAAPTSLRLAKLDEAALGKLATGAGFALMSSGRSSKQGNEWSAKVKAAKVAAGQEVTIDVRCGGKPEASITGRAYFVQGECVLGVDLKKGIAPLEAESKELLEKLLAARDPTAG